MPNLSVDQLRWSALTGEASSIIYYQSPGEHMPLSHLHDMLKALRCRQSRARKTDFVELFCGPFTHARLMMRARVYAHGAKDGK